MSKLLNYAEKGVAISWKRIEHVTTLPELEAATFRIAFGLFLLLFQTPHFSWIGDVPSSFFDPPILSVANLFERFPPKILFLVYDFLTPILFMCITLGIKTRWSCIAAGLLYLFVSGFYYSFGKINHDILAWLSLTIMGFSNWGTQLAIVPDKPQKYHQFCISLIAVIIAFGMVTAGFKKALRWIDFDTSTSGFMAWMMNTYFSMDRNLLLAPVAFRIPAPIIELGEYLAVLMELSGFLFLFLGRFWWQFWITLVCAFHLANNLFLNIPFTSNAIVYFGFFIYPFLQTYCPSIESRPLTTRTCYPAFILAVLLTMVHLIQRLTAEGARCLFVQDLDLERYVILYLSTGIYAAMVILGFMSLRDSRTWGHLAIPCEFKNNPFPRNGGWQIIQA